MVRDWDNHGDDHIKVVLAPTNSKKRKERHYLYVNRNSKKVQLDDPLLLEMKQIPNSNELEKDEESYDFVISHKSEDGEAGLDNIQIEED